MTNFTHMEQRRLQIWCWKPSANWLVRQFSWQEFNDDNLLDAHIIQVIRDDIEQEVGECPTFFYDYSRLDVLGSSSDKSTVRACASIKSGHTIWFRNFSYLPMKSFSTNGLASQGADSHIASRVVTFYPYNFQNLSHLTMTNSSHITMSESTQTTTVVSADITARKEYPNLELSTYKQLQGLLNLAMYQSKADVSLTMDFIQMLKTRNMEKAQWRKEHPIVNEVQSS